MLPSWQAGVVCAGVFVLLVPLLLGPWWISAAVAPADPWLRPIVAGLVGVALAVAVFAVIARVLGVPPRAIFLCRPTRRTLGWATVGWLLGCSLTALTVASTDGTLIVGAATARAVGAHMFAGAAIGLWTGTVEELLMRGAVLSILGHKWGWLPAVVVTAAIFGAMHNEHAATGIGTALYVAITASAGVFFATMTLATGNVWNAVAVHAAWNTLFSEYLLVFETGRPRPALLQYEIHAGPWLVESSFWSPTESPTALGIFLMAQLLYVLVRSRTHPSELIIDVHS